MLLTGYNVLLSPSLEKEAVWSHFPKRSTARGSVSEGPRPAELPSCAEGKVDFDFL